jgi:nitroreductase
MELYEAIEKRRTIRGFTRGTTEEVVKKIIMAGTRAMSADNSQPWEFIIVDDPQLIEQIAEHKRQLNASIHPKGVADQQKKAYKNCNVVAACYKEGGGYHWSMWSCIQNMALAATAEGLGIVPSTLWGGHQTAVEKLLGLPDGYRLATMVLIGVQRGYPRAKTPQILRRPEFSWLHRNRFGTPAVKA